ncbi:MAG: tRNA (guanosine(46)-N7)-methyltransferase TrmB [Firmicutes bacterium]|nr:tRNA (guanosine(46)-N7)-methyltransferase TrmB [Bacillota bacterium]
MRMRKKPNLLPRMDRCSDILIRDPGAQKGHWQELKPDAAALWLEIGCGKGRFTAETAAANPNVLYIAIERVPDAMVIAMERCQEKGLTNVFFVDGDAALLRDYFAPDELDRIFINFCDPWPSHKHARRRLTHVNFLVLYRGILKVGGQIHFKSDNRDLYEYSLFQFPKAGFELSEVTRNLHENGIQGIMTDYEEKFHNMGTPINRCVGTKRVMDPEPEFHPIVGPDQSRAETPAGPEAPNTED